MTLNLRMFMVVYINFLHQIITTIYWHVKEKELIHTLSLPHLAYNERFSYRWWFLCWFLCCSKKHNLSWEIFKLRNSLFSNQWWRGILLHSQRLWRQNWNEIVKKWSKSWDTTCGVALPGWRCLYVPANFFLGSILSEAHTASS